MSNFQLSERSPGFRFVRPVRAGGTQNLHPYVREALQELEEKLRAGFEAPSIGLERRAATADAEARRKETACDRLLPTSRIDSDAGYRPVDEEAAKSAKKYRKTKAADDEATRTHRDAATEARKARAEADRLRIDLEKQQRALIDLLGRPIYSVDPAVPTLLSYVPAPGATTISLAEYIDRRGRTKDLYAVKHLIDLQRSGFDETLRAILDHEAIVDYLFARAAFFGGFDTPEAIISTFSSPTRGARVVYDFLLERSLALMREDRRVELDDPTLLQIFAELKEDGVPIRHNAFESAITEKLEQYVFGAEEQRLLRRAEQALGFEIPDEYVPALLRHIQWSNEHGLEINDQNAAIRVATALERLQESRLAVTPARGQSQVEVHDYSVSYYEDRTEAVEYDRASIEAAAQMYLTMVWGDELGIFEVVDRIAMQARSESDRPIHLEIRSRQLSDDLRMYVLDEEFLDLKTGRVNRRVAPAERQMFYRQLFGLGEGPVVEERQVNTDFLRLWAVLMTEGVRYITKIEENGESYGAISSQKVYQAIEDLQYNLSAYCTGLPKIAAPTIHAELDFVVQRILDSDDVKRQLGRRGSPSFWRVVEEVRGRQDFTPLRNKGMFGHQILSTVARATPALLEDQREFERFISTLEAYIVAEDQLAEGRAAPQIPSQFPGFYGFDPEQTPVPPFSPSGQPGGNGATHWNGRSPDRSGNGAADDWNF